MGRSKLRDRHRAEGVRGWSGQKLCEDFFSLPSPPARVCPRLFKGEDSEMSGPLRLRVALKVLFPSTAPFFGVYDWKSREEATRRNSFLCRARV